MRTINFMKVCGFTFVRNGVKFEFPFRQAILSILPVCDEVYVAVGKSDDDTLNAVRSLGPKIKIIETVWDESLKKGGVVLANETDKAFRAIPDDYDWAFYIQGDEIVHEKYLPIIKTAMEQWLHDKYVDGLLFKYLHFYGGYDYVGARHSWYRREIRVVRNNKAIYSYRDAQGFRKDNNKKLKVKLIDAYIYHYGWVRSPKVMQSKIVSNLSLYNNGKLLTPKQEEYQYEDPEHPVIKFDGTHPEVMKELVANQNWTYRPNSKIKYASLKDWVKKNVAKWTGWIPGEYRNYKIIK